MMPQDPVPFYITGGTMSRHAASYVARQADETLFHSLRQGELCYVLTPRQMGKSSLMVRTADRLVRSGVRVVLLDLSALGPNLTVVQWYEGMLRYIGAQRHLEEPLDAFLTAHASLPPLERWLKALREVILPDTSGSLVIFIDEIDMVRSLPFPTDDFFTGIRACYNRRDADPAFGRLTFCLLGVASPSDLIDNVNITPFNVGKRIELHDFTATEASTLAQGMDSTGHSNGNALLSRVLYWTAGHPYLTQLLCAAIAADPTALREADVDRLCTELFLTKRAQDADDNLAIVRNRLLRSDDDLMALLTLYGRVRAGKRVDDEETNPLCSVLKLSGIARVEKGLLRVRNRIYAQVFDREWIAKNLPGAEVRRQRAAYQHGVRRASALAGVVLAVLTGLTAVALKQADRANRNSITASRNRKHADDNARNWQLAVTDERRVALLAVKNAQEANREKQRANKQAAVADARRKQANAAEAVATQATLQAKLSAARANAQAIEAAKQRDIAEHQVYIGAMNLIRASYERNDFDQVEVMLARTRSSRFRGFEWGYWNRLCHLALITLKAPSERNEDRVTTAVYSPDGMRIAATSADGTVQVWDTTTGRETLKIQRDLGSTIAFSSDGKSLIILAGVVAPIAIDAVDTGKQTLTFKQNIGNVSSAALSPDGRRLVTGTYGAGPVLIWDTSTGQQVLALKRQYGPRASVAFSSDGKRIVVGSADTTPTRVGIWDADTGQQTLILQGNYTLSSSVAFSRDGKWIVTGSHDYTARVWNAATGAFLRTLKGHGNIVTSVAFSPDSKRIVTAGSDSTVRMWDVATGQETLTLQGHHGPTLSVAFSPDGKSLVTGSLDGTARVWHTDWTR